MHTASPLGQYLIKLVIPTRSRFFQGFKWSRGLEVHTYTVVAGRCLREAKKLMNPRF